MTWLSPWWLIAISTASLPVIIHLLNRFRHRTVDWAAMDFLYRAVSKQRRRLEMETLILLAVRTLAVLALALAMARPLATGRAAAFAGSAEKRLAVLIDVSASMSAAGGKAGTLLDRARARAKEIIACTVNIAHVDIIAFADKPTVIYRGSAARFSAEGGAVLERIRPGFAEGSPAAALDAALELAAESPEAVYTVIILTDAQRSNWTRASANRWRELTRKALELDNPPALVFLKLRRRLAENLAIRRASIPGWSLLAADAVEVQLEVANTGSQPVKTDLSLFEGDSMVAPPEIIELEPNRSTQAVFSVGRDALKTGLLRCELGDDEFSADNFRYLVFDVETRPRILIVNGEPSPRPSADEVFRLTTLLSPGAEAAAGPKSAETVSRADFKEMELQEYAVVALANVSRLSKAEAAKLSAAVQLGASAFFFLGDKVDIGEYNRVLRDARIGLLPMKLKGIRRGDSTAVRIPESAGPLYRRLRSKKDRSTKPHRSWPNTPTSRRPPP